MSEDRLMTQAEAWTWMADQWKRKAGRRRHGRWGIRRQGSPILGLCSLLSALNRDHRISDKTYTAMDRKIEKVVGDEDCTDYWPFAWPTNKKGARPRIAFCLKQARLLRRKQRCRRRSR